MYFATAGIEVHPLLPPVVAFIISFFTSMGGVSGAFLLVPFQMSVLGFTNPSLSSTNQVYNIVGIPSGVWQYIKEKRMVWPLTWIVVFGTLPGVLIGAFVRIRYLPDPRNFKIFAASVLFYLGARLVYSLLKKSNSKRTKKIATPGTDQKYAQERSFAQPIVNMKECSLSEISYEFGGEIFHARTKGIFFLSLVVGIVGGIYGIGGGSIIAPFFVAFYGLPVYTIAGATLMGTLVTSIAGSFFYQAIAPLYPGVPVAPDWTLGFLFGIGGMCGMYFGARAQKYVPAIMIKWALSVMILFLAFKYIFEFFAY